MLPGPIPTMQPSPSPQGPRKVDQAMEEAAQLAGTDLPPADFYTQFLAKTMWGVDAPAGAIWLRTPQGFLQLQCQANIALVNLDKHKGGRQSHNELLRQAFQMARPMLLEPYGSSAILDGIPAGNPTEFVTLLAPILQDNKEAGGLVELWSDPKWDARTQRACLNYLVQMGGYAAAYLKNQSAKKLVGQESLWTQLEAFTREAHSSLDPTRVAYTISNEARRLIGCDRVSVAVTYDGKAKIEAVSGSDVVEKRSNLVMLMRTLTDKVLKWGERLTYQGSKDESLPPDVLSALDDFLAESNSKLLVIQPLRDERQKDLPGVARAALLMECFEPPAEVEPLLSRMDVIGRHSTSALYNAAELKRVPLMWLWWPLMKVQDGLGGKKKAIISAIVAGVALLALAMVAVPYPLKMDANGQLLPKERQRVYPTHEGTVKEFLVTPNQVFGAGQNLAKLFDPMLKTKLDTLAEEARTAEASEINLSAMLAITKDPAQQPKFIGEREKASATKRAKTREREELLRINNADPSAPGYFWLNAPEFQNRAARSTPPEWTVLDAEFKEQYLSRYVRPSDPILRLGDKKGPWELEIKIPQKHIGQVLRAFPSESPDAVLPVDILVTSEPTSTYRGIMRRGDVAGQAQPNTDDHNEQAPIVIAYVSLDDASIPAALRVPPRLLVPGVEVHTKVRCGNYPMGYSLFYGVWEFIYEKVIFFF